MRCPTCNGYNIGKIGRNHFFCRECYVEFVIKAGYIEIYEINDDGSAVIYCQKINDAV
ncbi:hypothetical protein ALPO108162_11190 [Alicyclobacillus pomorum]